MLRSRILTGLVGAVLAGIIGSQVASCTLDIEGTKPAVQEPFEGGPCADDSNCQNRLPCSPGTCLPDKKVCLYTPQADGPAPAIVQTPADCLTVTCKGGEASTEADTGDFFNDNNSCTNDACVDGTSTNTPLADGDMCDVGVKMGTCTAGKCDIACTNTAECDDKNPCSEDICNTGIGKCEFTFLDGVLTPGATQVPSDCKVQFCSNGKDSLINDDGDVFDDQNPCTDNICTAGVPSNPPLAAKASCMLPAPDETNVCDGNGTCVECVDKDDCVKITESECEKRSCVNNKCVIAYEPTSTLASPVLQVANDCKKVVCSGMANPLTLTVNDDADLPNNSNPCKSSICNNGVPMTPNEPQGKSCGNNQVCNATGDCVGCNQPSDCMGADTFCATRTCVNNVCGFNYTGNGTDLPTGQTAGDCKVLECDGAGNVKTSVLQSDVPVDNNACTQDLCNAMGTPSNPATMANSPCSVGMNDACDGMGSCKKSLGKTCGGGSECVSTRCVDGVCCNGGCTTLCEACNVPGSLGTCIAVPKGQDDGTCTGTTQSCNGSNDCDDENGVACIANSACLSNFCVDGVCCNNACDTACKSCNVTNSVGTCSNSPAGSQDNVPTNLCIGMNQCDGNGVCKRIDGSTCTQASQCLSGNCVDGYCCDTTCTADCKSCNVPSNLGKCTNVVVNTDDGMCSGSTESCDGMGGCKLENGATCAMGAECFSTRCIDGVCCSTDCTGLCKACNVAGMLGTCSNIPAGTDPGNECTDQMASSCDNNGFCDGIGACQNYAAGTECLAPSCTGSTLNLADACNGTGTCVDGGTMDCAPFTCSGMACETMCTTNAQCASTGYCDMSMCVPKKAVGQPCDNGGQCLSGNCAGNPKECKP